MAACFSCHSLCENTKTYRVHYGAESLKTYAPGNYDEYNKKGISEQVVSDEVSICGNCRDKAGPVSMYKYAAKLWSEGAGNPTGTKSCYRCHFISESRFCNHYKIALPWWLKYFIDIGKIEPTIDLGPMKHMMYCNSWKSLSSIDENLLSSLKSQYRLGLYLVKYHKKIRKKLKGFLFRDVFSFHNFVDKIQGFFNSNSSDTLLGLSYSYLVYKPYRNILSSDIYRKYYDTITRLKHWAEALS